MRKTVTNRKPPAPVRSRLGGRVGFSVSSLLGVWLLASVLLHPLRHEASDRADAPLLLGADIPPSVVDVFAKACANCHSEKTRWPWYSHFAPVSWIVENDVKRARERLNLSRWNSLDAVEQRVLLTAIATVIENREMPLHRYVVLHPGVMVSTNDSVRVIEWTHAERRRLRITEAGLTPK